MATPASPERFPPEKIPGGLEQQNQQPYLVGDYGEKPSPVSTAFSQKIRRRQGAQDSRSTVAFFCAWILGHQLAIALSLSSLLGLVHAAFPQARVHTRKFSQLSYYNDITGKYALGLDDGLFVILWIVLLTGLRAGVIDYVFIPLASRIGIEKNRVKVRFAEQAWLLCYHSTSWAYGMHLWHSSTYWMNLRALWADFPTREIDGSVKYYYLVAFAFWLAQLAVVNIEERRKDHLQMCAHHIITCALMFGSYCYHQTKVGNVILCLMDVVDLFFSLAKILKYLDYRLACDIAFGVFMVVWFLCRHIVYLAVCWSIYAHAMVEPSNGCYRGSAIDLEGPLPAPDQYNYLIQPFLDNTGLICQNVKMAYAFLITLLALQSILLVWLYMIFRVAYKVVTGEGAADDRSDDEASEDEEEGVAGDARERLRLDAESRPYGLPTSPPIEKEVGFDEIRVPSSRLNRAGIVRRSTRRSDGHTGATSGVSLRGSSDRKQLLGRIGCDQGT